MPDFDTGSWDAVERRLFDDAVAGIGGETGQEIADDQWLGFLYHEAMWDWDIPADQRAGVYSAFEDYVRDTYGIEWDDYFDWLAYRKRYDRHRKMSR